MAEFIKGLDLSEAFFREAVKPIIGRHWPGLKYSAGRLDYGSDVLGFDTPRSMDHDWGPRLTLFIENVELKDKRSAILQTLGMELPLDLKGFPTHYAVNADHTTRGEAALQRPINHAVSVTSVEKFCRDYLGLASEASIDELDWLLMPQQKLRSIASGRLFRDDLKIELLRQELAWYPHDIWLHLLACQWQRVNQEEPFVGRCGELGDELGSRLVGARLANEMMKICFLLEKSYAPYSKWFGTAFAQLNCAAEITPLLNAALAGTDQKGREKALGALFLAVLKLQNRLGLTVPVGEKLEPFFTRPYLVLGSHRVVQALFSAIESEAVKRLPRNIGSIDQVTDSTDILSHTDRSRRFEAVYRDRLG